MVLKPRGRAGPSADWNQLIIAAVEFEPVVKASKVRARGVVGHHPAQGKHQLRLGVGQHVVQPAELPAAGERPDLLQQHPDKGERAHRLLVRRGGRLLKLPER